MHENPDLDNPEGTPRDPRLDALASEWNTHRRAHEHCETEHHESLGRRRIAYATVLDRKNLHADLIQHIELHRLQAQRELRSDLEHEWMSAQDLACRAFANLSLAYIPGQTTVADLYHCEPLPEAEAAARAGVTVASTVRDALLKVLKYLGMVGCLLLGTIGMGALLLHIPPKAILHSPLAVVALGLAFILVGGAYLTVIPPAHRQGAATATCPDEPRTKHSRIGLYALVGVVVLLVALVDTKALVAINATRALINPASVPSFFVTFIVALALSAMYVLGTAMLAYSEGYGIEAGKRIEAEQTKHREAFRDHQRYLLEVSQACEALNAIAVIESRQRTLDDDITKSERHLRQALADAFADLGPAPEMPVEHVRDLRYHEQETRFANQKLTGYERVHAKRAPRYEPKTQGGVA